VQAAQQERDRLEKEADAYANQVTAGARGEAARLLEEAEAYRAQAVNARRARRRASSRSMTEYVKAPEITRRRLYLETMERVLGGMNKVILDGVSGGEGGQGVVPFLPLNELGRMNPAKAAGDGRRDQLMRAMYIFRFWSCVVVTALSSVFIVDERKKALVLQFGEVTQVKKTRAWASSCRSCRTWSITMDRILGLQTQPIEVTLLADRRLVVDAFARWRIVDLVSSARRSGPRARIGRRQLLGNILQPGDPRGAGQRDAGSGAQPGPDRADEPDPRHRQARRRGAGVDVIDVRLTRTDLPEQNLDATFARMRAEREREAADEIARGGEAAQRVRAAADRTVVELTSDARRQADVIRGEADAERNRILAEAYGKDPEFFAFLRSLTAYEVAEGREFVDRDAPDSEFFDLSAVRNPRRASAQRRAPDGRRRTCRAEPAPAAEPRPRRHLPCA
jgi:membrane protease subunit HflC